MESTDRVSRIVLIPDCTISQLVGDETFKIASGALSLEELKSSTLEAELVIKIEEASFALPIERDAIVGTKGDRSYLVSKKITAAKPAAAVSSPGSELKDVPLGDDSGSRPSVESVSLVQIDMSVSASEADLTKFEKCLVDHGFLMVGTQADADNLSRGFLEWMGIKSKDLRSYTLKNTTAGTPTDQPTSFSSTTHQVSSSTASGSNTLAEAATKVGETINLGMASIGSFIGSKVGTKGIFSGSGEDQSQATKDVKEAFSDGAESVQIVGSGVVDGTKHAAAVASDAASKAIEHNYGQDAVKLKEEAATTLSNVGSVGVTAFEQSSAIMHGAQVGKGAVTED